MQANLVRMSALMLALGIVGFPATAQAQIYNPFAPSPQIEAPERPGDRGLWFHNQTNQTIYVAIVNFVGGSSGMLGDGTSWEGPEPDAWIVNGWFTVEPGRRVCVLRGDLKNRYYQYCANDTRGRRWGGNIYHLVHPTNAFNYNANNKDLVNRLRHQGFQSRGFAQIDTGDYTGFTTNLK